MGKSGRDWTHMYAIYGITEWQTLIFLILHAIIFCFLSIYFLLYFDSTCTFLEFLFPPSSTPFIAGLIGSVTALSSVTLFFAAGNFLYSSVPLRWIMAQRMIRAIPDWTSVRNALDVGCGGGGILLNAVAMQMKKEGSSGRVVGIGAAMTPRFSVTKNKVLTSAMAATLRTAAIEGVAEYVTCRVGDPRRLPFADGYFDVVVSGAFVHTIGREMGRATAGAAAERARVITEMVRVLKGDGIGVVWDLVHVSEYISRLKELKMEEITVSERVTAFMASSHIVSFKKPSLLDVRPTREFGLEWRYNI